MYAQLLPTEIYIRNFRETIPADSRTAACIDRRSSWLKIASAALQDGYTLFAEHVLAAYEMTLRRAC